MYRLGIIEESLSNRQILNEIEQYLLSRRIECVPDDPCPQWHINEYAVPEEKIAAVTDGLKTTVMPTWYAHAFNESKLYVVLIGACFEVSPHKEDTWNEMIEYGVHVAKVERIYLERIPLHI